MDTQTFLKNFGYIADSHNGVEKLRELILSLAMKGNLVGQNLNDEPASELLKQIYLKRNNLESKKNNKSLKVLPEIKPEEKIPEKTIPPQLIKKDKKKE